MMDQAGLREEDKKILNLRDVSKRIAAYFSGIWAFTKGQVPQIVAIWVGLAVLMEIPIFIEYFNQWRLPLSSNLFTIMDIHLGQPVDMTPFFLVAIGAIVMTVFLAAFLGGCSWIYRRCGKGHPVKLEATLERFAEKMRNEMSSCLGHGFAATAVLMVEGRIDRYGPQVVHICILAMVGMYVFAGMVYKKD